MYFRVAGGVHNKNHLADEQEHQSQRCWAERLLAVSPHKTAALPQCPCAARLAKTLGRVAANLHRSLTVTCPCQEILGSYEAFGTSTRNLGDCYGVQPFAWRGRADVLTSRAVEADFRFSGSRRGVRSSRANRFVNGLGVPIGGRLRPKLAIILLSTIGAHTVAELCLRVFRDV